MKTLQIEELKKFNKDIEEELELHRIKHKWTQWESGYMAALTSVQVIIGGIIEGYENDKNCGDR